MQRSHISAWQGVCLAAMFLLGSQAVIGASNEAGANSYIGVLIGLALALPAALVYARIKRLRPDGDLFETLVWAFGRMIGKVLVALVVWYALHLGAMTLRGFTEFITAATLPQTPQPVIALLVGAVAIWGAKSGQDTLGRWSVVFFFVVAVTLAVTLLLAIPYFDAENLHPVAAGGAASLIAGGTEAFAMPFAEIVVFLFALSSFKQGTSPTRVFVGGVAVGGVTLALLTLRDTLILGGDSLGNRYYPSYSAVRVLSFGDFFQRFEIVVEGVFLLCGLLKAAICLVAAAHGIARLFDLDDYKTMVAPTGLLMIVLSAILFGTGMEMFAWMGVYKYYAFPLEVLIPLAVWIAAEVKTRRKNAGTVRA